MAVFIKGTLVLFMLIGVPIALYGAWKLYGSARETSAPPSGRGKRGRWRPRDSDGSPGDEEERPSVHYVLSTRFLAILAVGLGFLLIPMLIWHVVVPTLETPAGVELTGRLDHEFAQILTWQVGPVTVRQMLIGAGVFMALMFLVAAILKKVT